MKLSHKIKTTQANTTAYSVFICHFYNKILLCIGFIVIFTLSSCGSMSSNVYIPGNETFVLGDISNKSYKADLTNTSFRTVTLKIVETKTQQVRQEVELGSKESITLQIQGDETVYIINNQSGRVRIKASLSKGIEGMRYIPTE